MVPKFRAWDIKYKMMMRVNQIDFEKKTVWLEADNGDHENRHTLTREFKDAILMQSTGLKDKNGVEIYKGSIVKPERNSPFVVTDFIEGKGIIQSVSISVGSYSLVGFYSGEELEVIGDIYTKPELLEDEK